jgi:decaprenylphospho-beta-D-erythro-pentofuranosid-2-ulose 2-reductase
MNINKKIVIIGATSSIAEHCARIWMGRNPNEMVLVGRNYEKVESVAKDLRVRNPSTIVSTYYVDFFDPSSIYKLVADIHSSGSVSVVLIAHGHLVDQDVCQAELAVTYENLLVNGISPVIFAEAFVGRMKSANYGTLAIIGSVAGDRGRKSNYVYGSAKSLLATYTQGMQHRLSGTDVKVVLIKPGPTYTPMTFHLNDTMNKFARVETVAADIVRGIDNGKLVVYTPSKWRLIMFILRCIPSFIFNRLDI